MPTLFLVAYLTPTEKLDLLINSSKYFDFIAPDFLRSEIHRHYNRLSKISRMTIEQVRESEFQICKDITFISEEQVQKSAWRTEAKLVADVDPKDTYYVAFTKHFRIWSGDRQLIKGLYKKEFVNFISTDELFSLRDQ